MEGNRKAQAGGKSGIFVILAFLAVVGLAPETRASGQNESGDFAAQAGNRPTGIEQQGETFIVNSTADSGPNTLRQLLGGVWDHDIITFDPTIFPPSVPVTIFLTSGELPHILRPNVTVDASNAGVVLDGSSMSGGWVCGLQIVSSDACVIRGLQFSNFSGAGIAISGYSKYNVIGGDRSLGAHPLGQGNQFSHNDVGISLSTTGTSLNTITGNWIGTDATGSGASGNHRNGVWIYEGANRNTIGPDNVIAYNGGPGVNVHDQDSLHNTITQNSIHDNGTTGINLWGGGNANILNCNVLRNYGGGINCSAGSNTTITNCAVSDNTGHHGGGIICNDSNVTIANCEVIANLSDDDGG
ncbi:MAG: right-handed parallel beta-helix repeat-containing protein, partial [Planctomycetota bacterium]